MIMAIRQSTLSPKRSDNYGDMCPGHATKDFIQREDSGTNVTRNEFVIPTGFENQITYMIYDSKKV